MFNPFLLAALVFGVIGLLQEASDRKVDPKESKVVKPKDAKPPAKAGDTIVNVGGTTVQTAAQKLAEVKKKADEKKPKEPAPSDG